MRDEITAGQCALCKTVLSLDEQPVTGVTHKWVCATCAEYRKAGSNPRPVRVLDYPVGVLDEVSRFLVFDDGQPTARRVVLEKLAAGYFDQCGMAVAYCPQNYRLDRWAVFLTTLGFTVTTTKDHPWGLYRGYEQAAVRVLFSLDSVEESLAYGGNAWRTS